MKISHQFYVRKYISVTEQNPHHWFFYFGLGFPTKAFITRAGAKFVDRESLKVRVIDERNVVIYNVCLISVGSSSERFFVKFPPPFKPFKLQLHEKTKKEHHLFETLR